MPEPVLDYGDPPVGTKFDLPIKPGENKTLRVHGVEITVKASPCAEDEPPIQPRELVEGDAIPVGPLE